MQSEARHGRTFDTENDLVGTRRLVVLLRFFALIIDFIIPELDDDLTSISSRYLSAGFGCC